MTGMDPSAHASPGSPMAGMPEAEQWGAAIRVESADVTVPLGGFAASLAALLFALLSPLASVGALVALWAATLLVPLVFLVARLHRGGEITIPILLMTTSLACGPIGGLGCAYLAFSLRHHRPKPSRLRSWYEYIAGVVARERIVHLHDELSSGRLSHEPAAEVPRFRPILHGTSTDEQQRVLGVLGRRYHADFRPALRDALRNKNSFIRAQAAAVASRLDAAEKKKLWSSAPPVGTPDAS